MKIFTVIFLLSSTVFTLQAQDTHYWTHRFGPNSTLLSGSDAAVSKDNSATFNNPGGLALVKKSSISITTNAYGIDKSNFVDGAGKGMDLKSTSINSIPLILSGIYRPKKLPRITLGYTMVDRVRYKFNATQRFDGMINVLDDAYSPGEEEYVSQVDIKSNISEIWAGICISYRINNNWAVGIANYGGYREHQFSYSHIARAIKSDLLAFETVSSDFLYNISYVNVRNLFKLGVSVDYDDFAAGLTVTMPGFTMYSNATLNSDLTGNNVNYGSFRQDFIANDRQEKLKARYRSPWNIAFGLSKKIAKSRVYLTTQYFSGQKQYTLIEPRPNDFVRPSGLGIETSKEILLIADGRKPVWNVAIGVESQIHKKIWLLAGIRNDNSYYNESSEDIGNVIAITNTNLYHASLGAMLKRPKQDICVGFKASYGKGSTFQFENISEPVDDVLLIGETSDAVYKYMSVSFVIGYIHYLK